MCDAKPHCHAGPLIDRCRNPRRCRGAHCPGRTRSDTRRCPRRRDDSRRSCGEVFGLAQREPDPAPMRRATWFDLASLTKVLFTTPTILHLVSQGHITLDDPLTRAIPDLRQYHRDAAERRLTFRQCLSIRPTYPPSSRSIPTASIRTRACLHPSARVAGRATRLFRHQFYAAGHRDRAAEACTLADLELPPGLTWHPEASEPAATERCTWRGRVMRGEVHDENAFALGGAAGHAGLSDHRRGPRCGAASPARR